MITDGKQTRNRGPYTKLKVASGRLKAKGVRVYSLGIGKAKNIVMQELRDVASSPKYIYRVASFKLLVQEIDNIVRGLCEGV